MGLIGSLRDIICSLQGPWLLLEGSIVCFRIVLGTNNGLIKELSGT